MNATYVSPLWIRTALAETCRSGDLRLSIPYRNFVGSGVLEICRGFGEIGGWPDGVWRKVCLQKDQHDSYGNPANQTSGLINARVVCEQLKSQNNWNFDISGSSNNFITLSRMSRMLWVTKYVKLAL